MLRGDAERRIRHELADADGSGRRYGSGAPATFLRNDGAVENPRDGAGAAHAPGFHGGRFRVGARPDFEPLGPEGFCGGTGLLCELLALDRVEALELLGIGQGRLRGGRVHADLAEHKGVVAGLGHGLAIGLGGLGRHHAARNAAFQGFVELGDKGLPLGVGLGIRIVPGENVELLIDIGKIAIGLLFQRIGPHAAGIGDGLATQLHAQLGRIVRAKSLERRAFELRHLLLKALFGRGGIRIVLEFLSEIVDPGHEARLAIGNRRGPIDLLDLLAEAEGDIAEPAKRLAEPGLRLAGDLRAIVAARLQLADALARSARNVDRCTHQTPQPWKLLMRRARAKLLSAPDEPPLAP